MNKGCSVMGIVRNALGLSFMVGILLCIPTASVQALGVSPPRIEVKSVLRGTSQTKKLQLVRLPSEQGELVVDVETFGPYARFLKAPTIITIPSGQDEYIFPFDIMVPQDAANGTYEAGFRFFLTLSPRQGVQKGGASMGVRQGVQASVRFSVSGDQVVAYELSNLHMYATEVGLPLRASFDVTNQGNVVWQPEKIELQFIDSSDATHIVQETILGTQVMPVTPGANGESVELHASSLLSEGRYAGSARIFNQDGKEIDLATQSFLVYPEGTLAQAGELRALSTNKSLYASGEKIKLEAKFKNTGQIGVKAVLLTEITKGDSVLDMVRSDELFVEKNNELVFSQLLPIEDSGTYMLSSYVQYGNHQTDKKQVEIHVRSSPVLIGSVVVLTLLSIVCILLVVLKRKSVKNKLNKK